MNRILEELKGLRLSDGTKLSDVAVLLPHIINIDFDSEDGRNVAFDVVPINETFIRIEAQVIDEKRRLYRQVVALTNNPSYFIETIKELASSGKLVESKMRMKNTELEMVIRKIVVPNTVFDKWITALNNRDSLVVFDVAYIENEEKSVLVKEDVDVLRELISLPSFDTLFGVLEKVVSETSNVKKRTVRAFKCGAGYCVAIGRKDSEEYRRYRVPIENEKKYVILLIPEDED